MKDLSNFEKISEKLKVEKEHFQNNIDIDYFELNQAVLEDFVSYMIIKIKKEKLMQN